MNIQEYIASGILEMYALGQCSEQERRDIEQLLEQHPELSIELATIEETLEKLALGAAIQPPTEVKQRIFQEIGRASSDQPIQETKVIQGQFRYKWLAVASIALLIGSGIGNIVLYEKYSGVSDQLAQTQQEKSVLAEELQLTKAGYSEYEKTLAYIQDPNVQVVRLQGVEASPNSKVTLYWNKSTSDVYLAVNELPQPPTDKQYQLWAIVDGQPVDAGVLEMDGDSGTLLQKMNGFNAAQAFAVTLEQKGGSPTPTLEAMYVIANV